MENLKQKILKDFNCLSFNKIQNTLNNKMFLNKKNKEYLILLNYIRKKENDKFNIILDNVTLSSKNNLIFQRCLKEAAAVNNEEITQKLINLGVDCSFNNCESLILSAQLNSLETSKLLIKNIPKPILKKNLLNILQFSILNNNLSISKLIISSINLKSLNFKNNNETIKDIQILINWAIKSGNEKNLDLIFENFHDKIKKLLEEDKIFFKELNIMFVKNNFNTYYKKYNNIFDINHLKYIVNSNEDLFNYYISKDKNQINLMSLSHIEKFKPILLNKLISHNNINIKINNNIPLIFDLYIRESVIDFIFDNHIKEENKKEFCENYIKFYSAYNNLNKYESYLQKINISEAIKSDLEVSKNKNKRKI